jgi:hypothetical protein
VLIELVDAVVADGAVVASGRAVDFAGPAELEPHLDAIDDESAPFVWLIQLVFSTETVFFSQKK